MLVGWGASPVGFRFSVFGLPHVVGVIARHTDTPKFPHSLNQVPTSTRYPNMHKFSQLVIAAILGGVVSASLVILLLPSAGSGVAHPASSLLTSAPATSQPVVSDGDFPTSSAELDTSTLLLPNVAPDLRTAARRATPSTVHITARPAKLSVDAVKRLFSERETEGPDADGEGSGVFYRADGHIVTNWHVVRNAGTIQVRTANRQIYPAELVGFDSKSDLAVLKVQGTQFPTLSLADSDLAQPGQWVLAVGNPLGLSSTVTAGIVSAKGRNIRLLRELDAIESFIQTDAAVNPGNSGGPLVTADGKLLGINTAIASQTGLFQGYSFAIPINLVSRIVDDIIEFGEYRRAFLGVEISTLTSEDIRRLSISDRTEGVMIDGVLSGGSAEAAGLRKDDLVLRVGDRNIRDLPELTELIGRTKVGETLKVTVLRDGRPLEVVVTMLAYAN